MLDASDVRVFFYLAPFDMRKQMDGLSTLVREEMKRDPQDGELCLFRNRTRGLIKILFYDHDGCCLPNVFAKDVSRSSSKSLKEKCRRVCPSATLPNFYQTQGFRRNRIIEPK
ncbi:MAG: IS66 family insertion sequence element accessory protein TnpB [Myxococcales bacterium]|nr:IS66 family insertion sequence element accessory protein TnpB [Myxococcales bacterium]